MMQWNFYLILIYLLASEVLILFLLVVVLLFHRVFVFFQSKRTKKKQNLIAQGLLKLIEQNLTFESATFSKKLAKSKELVLVLETFNRRLKGEEWERLRMDACRPFLIKKARRFANSIFWTKRHLAARIFALCPLIDDEARALKLMKDHNFLVKSAACLAIIRMESKQGIYEILKRLSIEKGYSEFYYRDSLLQGSKKIFSIIIELAQDPNVHLACLDVLAAGSWTLQIPFLKSDLESKDLEIRWMAVKVLIRNPLPDSANFFLKAAKDFEEKIRIASFQGLTFYPSDEAFQILEKNLLDPSWLVRFAAAKALKKMGEKGIDLLKKQKEKITKEVAEYALQFG